MRKIINGVAYDTQYATNICSARTEIEITILGTKFCVTGSKTLMRTVAPKDGVEDHEVFKPYSETSEWLTTDASKLESKGGKFFFALAVGNSYASDCAVVPVDAEEARRFTETHAEYEEYVRNFGRPEGFDFDKARKLSEERRKAAKAEAELRDQLSSAQSELEDTRTKLKSMQEEADQTALDIEDKNAEIRALHETAKTNEETIAALRVEVEALNVKVIEATPQEGVTDVQF